MNVYLLESDAVNNQGLFFADLDKNWEIAYCFLDGISMKRAWIPIRVEVDQDGSPPGDFPILSGCISVFSRRAAGALEPLLRGNGELLPLRCDAGEYFALNVTRVVDALNADHSEIVYLPDGQVLDIKRFAFNARSVPANDIFKIPQVGTRLFVSERFAETVEESRLKGFLFKSVTIING